MLSRTVDIDQINSVLKHPDIWGLISDDEDKDTFTPPMENNHYLFDEGILFILHPEGEDLQIHANVIPENRGNAKQAASEALRYGFEELKAVRIIAKIPLKYGNVYGFAKKFMKDLGIVDGEHFLELGVEQWGLSDS